jgi:hypothetical protein
MAEDDRRLVNNPFARSVVRPDDEKATSPVMYVLFGLLSLVLAALFVAALVLPPLFTCSLLVRGVRTGRAGMLAAGALMAALYLLLFFAAGRKLMGRPKEPPTA